MSAAGPDREGSVGPLRPVLLIGGRGMLGRAWRRLLEQRDIDHVAPPSGELDLTRPATVRRHLTEPCRLVVNCAGWTDVDGAEGQRGAADRLNGTAIRELADVCTAHGAVLVHYSTDYVFGGDGSAPYRVGDPTAPINAYGHSKWLGEQALCHSACRFLLIRTSWLYSPWGENFVRTIARLAQQRGSFKVVNDQRGRPTSAEHLARASLQLLERRATGIYHVTDGGECTWFEFARAVAAYVSPSCRVNPCTSDEFPRPAKRPTYGVLDLSQTESNLGPMPHWHDNLTDVLRRLEPLTTCPCESF